MTKKLLATIFVVCTLLANTCFAVAEQKNMHYFLDIPFEGTTVANINELLESKGCVGFEKNPKVWSGTVESFQYLGYDCYVQFDFHGKENMSRVSIEPEGESWGKGEAYRTVFQDAARKFIDLDAKLTTMYGEPDVRFFTSGIDKYDYPTKQSRFQPTDGKWNEDELMMVFDNDDQHLRAYSVWGNVGMELWSNAGREFPKGYCCMLHVRYYEKDNNGNIELIDYPAE